MATHKAGPEVGLEAGPEFQSGTGLGVGLETGLDVDLEDGMEAGLVEGLMGRPGEELLEWLACSDAGAETGAAADALAGSVAKAEELAWLV